MAASSSRTSAPGGLQPLGDRPRPGQDQVRPRQHPRLGGGEPAPQAVVHPGGARMVVDHLVDDEPPRMALDEPQELRRRIAQPQHGPLGRRAVAEQLPLEPALVERARRPRRARDDERRRAHRQPGAGRRRRPRRARAGRGPARRSAPGPGRRSPAWSRSARGTRAPPAGAPSPPARCSGSPRGSRSRRAGRGRTPSAPVSRRRRPRVPRCRATRRAARRGAATTSAGSRRSRAGGAARARRPAGPRSGAGTRATTVAAGSIATLSPLRRTRRHQSASSGP